MMEMTIQSRLARYGVAVFLAIILVYGGTACPSVLAAPEVVNPAEAPGKNVPPAKVVPPTLTVTLQDEDDDMFHKFEEIFMPSNVRQQLAKAYTAPFKAATGASFNYTDSRDREVWVGGKALAIREDVLDKFEEDL